MKKFKNISDGLQHIVKQYGLEQHLLEGRVINEWNEIVGSRISRNTEIKKIENGIIYIKVKNDVWRNELMFYKKKFIDKINEILGKSVISDIRWI